MNRLIRVLIFLGLVSGLMAVPVGAQDEGPIEPLVPAPSAETGELTQESISAWFVELPSAPIADGGKRSTIEGEQRGFRSAAQAAGLQYTERFAFQTLWNGLSISVGPTQLGTLSRIAGVKALYPVELIPMPATSPLGDPELATALAMTGADIAQTELGLSGAGVRVAVMDTGIDYDHPDLGGCFGPGCRVVTGYDFVGDAFNADPSSSSYDPNPVPDPDPDDCYGHGTHVAGIIGANGGVIGVAPGVTFGAYRVFGCQGSTTADIMLAAMERALADDMDVLNMSIGSAFQWPQYPTSMASNRMVNHGMVVVASIGNSGANGVYSTGAPGNGDKVIGVASFDNTHVQLFTFTVTPAGITAGYGNAAAAPPAPTSGSLPMAKTGTPASTADGCNAGDFAAIPAGSAVLIRRGTCTFYQKSLNALNAGAAAVVLYNNVAGRFSPTVAGATPITIPVVAISDTEGVAINNAIAGSPQTLNWQSTTGTFLNPTGGLISSFSSYGLAPDLSFKPDLGAPGGLIRSTYPLEKGGYATISGTSMSSPHVAGAVALLLEALPNTPAQAVDEILQNSADPKPWWGNPGLGFLDNVHRQGAGMLDIDDAILATTRIEPSELALGESQAGPAVRTLTIRNTGPSDITYDLSHAPALSTRGSTFSPSFTAGFASVAFSVGSLFVPAGGSAMVDVTITANPGLADRSQYGGYIVFTPQGGGQIFRVPYAGFKGDYQSILALAPTPSAFPWLAKLTACTVLRDLDCYAGEAYANQPAGATYTMVGTDVPYILVHLDHQVRSLRMDVFEAGGNQSWHRALDLDYLGRNDTTTAFFAFPWDGTTAGGNQVYTVPDGQYVVVLTVLEALGDEGDPTHTETWTSPVITIDRP